MYKTITISYITFSFNQLVKKVYRDSLLHIVSELIMEYNTLRS
jgi:hypothetical protein